MTDSVAQDRVPVSILTGFLGSGKTTLLSKLIRSEGMDKVAVIINEFGEVGIDDALVVKSNEDTILLNNGCLCCTVRGDLVETMHRLHIQKNNGEIPEFNRLIVETTGLADPAPILHTMMSDQFLVSSYRLDGVVTVVDAYHAMSQFDEQFESVKQAAVADRIVLSKVDVTEPALVKKVKGRLNLINPAAPILEASHGEIEPSKLFDAGLYNPLTKTADVTRWLKEEAYMDTEGHIHGHEHHHHDVNRHDDHIKSFSLHFDKPLKWAKISGSLDMLAQTHGANILRIKGLINVEEIDNQPVVVHAVQHMFHPPAKIDEWPTSDQRSRLVFIVKDIDRSVIEGALNSYLSMDF
jgi:G3E family GTPase